MNKFAALSVLLCSLLALCSCSKVDDERMVFVGDSIIERWDVRYYFPTYRTVNYGKGGSGMEHLTSMAQSAHGDIAVVVSGTNEYFKWDDAYAEQYITAIEQLGGKEVYVFSILPRHFEQDIEGINQKIKAMNAKLRPMIEAKGWHYLDVYDQFMAGDDINRDLYNDGLHPSDHGYEIMTYELNKIMK